MDYTTLLSHPPLATDEESLPLASLYEALQELPDARRTQGKRYSLALILCLLVLAKLAGQKNLSGATQWLRHRKATLLQRFGVRGTRLPCQMTYCNVLAQMDEVSLDSLLSAFFAPWEAASVVVERNRVGC